MDSAIRFTDELTLRVAGQQGDRWFFELHLPLFAWLAHGHNPLLVNEIEPLFYIDTDETLFDQEVRASCETLWDAYAKLLDNGIADRLARQLLPVNLMAAGTVTFDTPELRGFVESHRSSPITELSLVACGYERALANGDRNPNADIN